MASPNSAIGADNLDDDSEVVRVEPDQPRGEGFWVRKTRTVITAIAREAARLANNLDSIWAADSAPRT